MGSHGDREAISMFGLGRSIVFPIRPTRNSQPATRYS